LDKAVPTGYVASKEPIVHPLGMTDERIGNISGMMPIEKC
jgi:hypothetical protein